MSTHDVQSTDRYRSVDLEIVYTGGGGMRNSALPYTQMCTVAAPEAQSVNLENRRHQESPKTDMHPHSTPQTTVSPYKIISENTRLAEMRFWQVPSINRLQTPTKIVLNRAFQVDTNTDRHLRWALRCCLSAAPPAAGKASGLAPCVRRKCPRMMPCARSRCTR